MSAARPRLLFVDDEPSLRLTVPAILKAEGFDVTAAATVSEALHLITTEQFDVLLSDLNIGELSDGFTVVSAMRRSQPKCRTLILTGFPDFDNALENIRKQADGYVLKPSRPHLLAETIKQRLAHPNGQRSSEHRRLCDVIENNKSQIVARCLQDFISDKELGRIEISDVDRVDGLPNMLNEVIEALRAERPPVQSESHIRNKAFEDAQEHGRLRRRQGYTLHLVFKEARILQCQLFSIAQRDLLDLDMSMVIPDLTLITDTIEVLVAESIQAFVAVEKPAA